MRVKHIYWFSYFNLEEPSVRYRAKFPLELLLSAHGITSSLIIPGYDAKNLCRFLQVYFSVLFFRKKDSVIVFQKIFTRGIYAQALKFLLFFRRKNTLYDIDDAEYVRRPAETIHYFMKHCAACTAGSQALVAYIHKFNSRAYLLTSPVIDHGFTWQRHKEAPVEPMSIGWIGYYGAHRKSLTSLLFPAICELPFPVTLHLLGVEGIAEMEEIQAIFQDARHVSLNMPQEIDWLDEHSIYAILCTLDIGVAPLIDNEFNRPKSAFKLKQYLSCGVPALASPVGENNAFLHHGCNGFFCTTPDDFREKFICFHDRREAVKAGFRSQEKASFQAFSVEAYCNTLLQLLA